MFLDQYRKLVAVLTTAKTTLNLPVEVDAVDLSALTVFVPLSTYTNGVTPVDIVAAPAAGTVRKVNCLNVYARDSAAKTIRIYRIDATPTTGLITSTGFVVGNDYQIVSIGTTDFTLIGASANTVGVIFTATGAGLGTGTAATAYQQADTTLQIDDILGYTDKLGWYAQDVNGNRKTVQGVASGFVAQTSTTGSAALPASTTANRDASPAVGYIRYNTSLNQYEGYGSSGWGKIGGGTSGGATDAAVYENDATITTSYTIGQGSLISGATISIATPGVVTLTGHGFPVDQQVFLETTGALPAGLLPDTGYWVISAGLAANTFELSATQGGAAINTTGTQSGVHSVGKLKNAHSAGTQTIATGATVTVPTGATWSIS